MRLPDYGRRLPRDETPQQAAHFIVPIHKFLGTQGAAVHEWTNFNGCFLFSPQKREEQASFRLCGKS